MHFSLKSLGMISLFVIAVSASNFAQTCENIESFGTTLQADCRENENGSLAPSSMDLNQCIKNNKGSLSCGKNGNYQGSCINCSLRGNTEMECMCRNVAEGHSFVRTQIDLNKCISNNHGQLGC
ncbi:hypothetical protein N7520_002530 [Penicillium odoratum]|uniref:uncharacterized protein n=1 Tax=Penicillium odoratum TaxID=1167516 RepID=UPI002549A664|nr:uncharacterized protein N7520_002530 [Penicillium odoratum]KAJ5772001.1 hypothetical protein N7520_002530 [Penicillium odoratum]